MATATNSTLGTIRLTGDLAGSTDGLNPQLTNTAVTPGSYTVPTITVDAKGRITAASSTTSTTLAGLIPNADGSTFGKVRIGSNITSSGGTISVPVATSSVLGTVKIDTASGLSVDGAGSLSFSTTVLPDATSSSKGIVQGGAGITLTGGVASVDAIPDATTSVKGVVQIGTGVSVSGGTISIPVATSSTLGRVKPGTGLSVDGAGSLSLNTAAHATSSTPGVVKLGSNLQATGGVISAVYNLASSSELGLVKIGSGLSIDGSGVVSSTLYTAPPIATTSSLGAVIIGTNVNVTGGGTISVNDASPAQKGVVQIGTNGITISAGVVSAVNSNGSTLGVVRSTTATDITITAGDMSIGSNIPKKDVANTFTKSQVSALVDRGTLSGAVTFDLSAGNVQQVQMGGNITIATPTNPVAGGLYTIIIKQPTSGTTKYDVTFPSSSVFKFAESATPIIRKNINGIAVLSLMYTGSYYIATFNDGFLGA